MKPASVSTHVSDLHLCLLRRNFDLKPALLHGSATPIALVSALGIISKILSWFRVLDLSSTDRTSNPVICIQRGNVGVQYFVTSQFLYGWVVLKFFSHV